MPLNDLAIRSAKPKVRPDGRATDKAYKIGDSGGLYLEVTPSGGKCWRLKYRFDGKEKRLALGVYPDVGLKDARARRDDARGLLAQGIDPGENRKAQKSARRERAANSFEVVAREWHNRYSATWVSDHGDRIIRRLERDIFPWLGGRAISEINAPELLSALRRIESRGALETAHRALGNCGQVFRYAIATGRATRDPSADLRRALPPVKPQHFAAVTDPKDVAKLLRIFEGYEGSLVVRCALRLAPLVFVRPGELRKAEWQHIDFDAAEWRYFVTKTQTDHIVPLSTQALDVLRELKAVTGDGKYLFPSARTNSGRLFGSPHSKNTSTMELDPAFRLWGDCIVRIYCVRCNI